MSELSPEARALLRDGLGALRPAANDRARIAGALASRLGPAALLVSSSAVAATTKVVLWQKLALTVASVGLVVAGASYVWPEPAREAPLAPSSVPRDARPVVPAVAAPAAVTPMLPSPEPATQAEETVRSEPKPTPAKAAAGDRLAGEVAILSRAMTVLRAGNPSEALRLLDSHRQQFPSGRLVEERRAARLQALCALGRRSEAESELARLERDAPKSPHVARAKRACGLN